MKTNTHYLFLLLIPFLLLLACNATKKATLDETEDSIIKHELIVQLSKDASMRQLLHQFKAYELRKLKVINESMNIWLLTYNTDLIEASQMLEKLKASKGVGQVEFNKKVKLRH